MQQVEFAKLQRRLRAEEFHPQVGSLGDNEPGLVPQVGIRHLGSGGDRSSRLVVEPDRTQRLGLSASPFQEPFAVTETGVDLQGEGRLSPRLRENLSFDLQVTAQLEDARGDTIFLESNPFLRAGPRWTGPAPVRPAAKRGQPGQGEGDQPADGRTGPRHGVGRWSRCRWSRCRRGPCERGLLRRGHSPRRGCLAGVCEMWLGLHP